MTATNIALALNLVSQLLPQLVSALTTVRTAQAEGRDVTEEELNALFSADDLAKAKLDADIKAAGG